MLNTFKIQFAQILSEHLPLEIEDICTLIVPAPENVAGDLAFPCFQLAKTMGKAPNLIANEFQNKIQDQNL